MFRQSDNLVSNEALFAHIIQRLHSSGGVYVGVGPEQNYSYIAGLHPVMAFIIDIREENRNLHLMYKALFEASIDRANSCRNCLRGNGRQDSNAMPRWTNSSTPMPRRGPRVDCTTLARGRCANACSTSIVLR